MLTRMILFIACLATLPIVEPVHAQSASQDHVSKISTHNSGTRENRARSCKDKKPWYCGTSEEQRSNALRLYNDGNVLFDNASFKGAATKYRKAIEYWDHPSIHYNLMLAMIGLDQPIKAYKSSIKALAYDGSALTEAQRHRARQNQQMLLGQFAWIVVVCDEPGTTISVDGKELLKAPGRTRQLVMPGQHEVTATKKDYLTAHTSLLMLPRKPKGVEFDMLHRDQAVFVERRWDEWKPWVVVGAGASLGMVGGVFQWRASVNNRRYQDQFDRECDRGCLESEYSDRLRSLERRSTWYRRTAYTAYAVGGTTFVTGLVLAYLNIPRRWENPRRNKLVRTFELTSEVRQDGGGITMNIGF